MFKVEKKLFRDSSLLILAQGFNKVIGFFYNVFLARVLGVSNFGEYILALSIFSLLSSAADLGMNQWLVRQVAVDQKNKSRVAEVLVSRYVVAGLALVGFGGYLLLSGQESQRGLYLLLAMAAVLPQAMGATMDAVAIGLRKFGISAISLMFMSLIQLLVGMWLTIAWGVSGSLIALLMGQLGYALILSTLVEGFSEGVKVSQRGVWMALKGAIPFGLLMLIGMAYSRLDTILLGVLKGNFDVGIYGAGYKFFEAVSIVPSAVGSAIFPYFSKLRLENPRRAESEFVKVMMLLMILAIFVVAGYWLVVPWVIRYVLPSYDPSIEVIKVLALGIPFYFGHNVVSVYLLAKGQGLLRVVVLSGAVLVINGVLNFLLIPKYGYMASAWVGVCSEISALLIYLSYAKLPRHETKG